MAGPLNGAPRALDEPGTNSPGVVITCEHAGNRIPAPYRTYFSGHFDLVRTHRGYDPGALEMARTCATALSAPLLASMVTRLVVDLNRSVRHPALHFDTIRQAPEDIRKAIVEAYYAPYRSRAQALMDTIVTHHGQVLHLSCHSFVPELDGKRRTADIGLLYDPKRALEASLCEQWQTAMARRDHRLAIRRNYPYRGNGDGLTTTFRRRYAPDAYLGIELEINQEHVFAGGHHWASLRKLIVDTLSELLQRPVKPDPAAARHPSGSHLSQREETSS
ncbi:N-formylglutamate amidohydrolase [Nitrogeniibacter aestuarii]|uniref:N-formylglutamate amidohydrolase n=1 Tax=Nitrogeniibacter aestuarii TaxID=2815343 RepID=UPI001D10CC31|nr:N-formylglutamate amidohydrolase [Nitrogeniibacter aestuarii]